MRTSNFSLTAVLVGGLLGLVICPNLLAQTTSVQLVNFTDNSGISPTVIEADVTVSGSADIEAVLGSGIGILGGTTPGQIDRGETVSFEFAVPVVDITIPGYIAIDGDGNGRVDLRLTFSAFDANGVQLGTVSASIDESGKVTGNKMAMFNMDWTPTTFQNEPVFFYALGITAVVMLLGWRRLKLSDLCLLAGLALMGTKLVRHIPFFTWA